MEPAIQPLAAPRTADDDSDELSRFVEQMGIVCEDERMPRIAGRVFGLFLVEGRPLSLKELADRLQVSRASVSTNTRMLAELGLLERVGVAGDRQDYYQLAPAPFEKLLTGLIARMTTVGDFLSTSAERFPADRADARDRVCGLASFYQATAEAMRSMLRRFGKPA